MARDVWISLSTTERNLLREALQEFSRARGSNSRSRALAQKIEGARQLPQTVLRVEGGFVEIEGNPNPVLMYDYDCDGEDDLLPDDEGRACIVSEYKPSQGRAT
jgi:hypothetical protein